MDSGNLTSNRQPVRGERDAGRAALEAADWKCPCDGAFKGQSRGAFQGHLFRDAARYLFMLRAMYNVTRDGVWLERYRKALPERPAKSDRTRIDICAAGYGLDREAIKQIDDFQLWIYVGSQASLAELVAMETDESIKARYRAGLAVNAKNVLTALESHKGFDNADTKVFGHANWRTVYTTWFPQRTQADAEKLSEAEDKTKGGKRKSYEAKYMRPLAAAAIGERKVWYSLSTYPEVTYGIRKKAYCYGEGSVRGGPTALGT